MTWTTADWIRLRVPMRYAQKPYVRLSDVGWFICHNNPINRIDPDGRLDFRKDPSGFSDQPMLDIETEHWDDLVKFEKAEKSWQNAVGFIAFYGSPLIALGLGSSGLVHLTSPQTAKVIQNSKQLYGGYVGPASNASLKGSKLTLKTGLNPGNYEGVLIPKAAEK